MEASRIAQIFLGNSIKIMGVYACYLCKQFMNFRSWKYTLKSKQMLIGRAFEKGQEGFSGVSVSKICFESMTILMLALVISFRNIFHESR